MNPNRAVLRSSELLTLYKDNRSELKSTLRQWIMSGEKCLDSLVEVRQEKDPVTRGRKYLESFICMLAVAEAVLTDFTAIELDTHDKKGRLVK